MVQPNGEGCAISLCVCVCLSERFLCLSGVLALGQGFISEHLVYTEVTALGGIWSSNAPRVIKFMAFPQLSASMLLASLILLLYWTTSSARSHDPTSSVVSPSYRVKRDQPFENREKVDKSSAVANGVLTVVKEVIEKIDTNKLADKVKKVIDADKLVGVMKSLGKIASLAPGIGGLVASVVNMVLIFIPQEDPVLNEVTKGFAEMNRKLDLLSIQISNLATDVEWFNYASIYSQDEVRILNSWKKFNEFFQKSQWVQSKEDKLRLAEIFVNYYENTGTEASVANLYHYLTVKDTSLSGNLNELLRKKFKCDFQDIGKYNVYFSRLLWQGMVLNQFYWNLIGLNSSGIEAEHTQMFNNVYAAQKSALIAECLDNYELYLKEDVVRISNGLSADDTTAIAVQVKEFLDKKYFWYNWVVMVYTDEEKNHKLYNMIKIPVDTCVNGGKCKRLLDSTEYLCECPTSYHGDRCENKIENQTVPAIIKNQTVPDITINAKLKKILDLIRRGH
ncbi:hypothetical protein PO909_021170 [Leuciscus waleckii]